MTGPWYLWLFRRCSIMTSVCSHCTGADEEGPSGAFLRTGMVVVVLVLVVYKDPPVCTEVLYEYLVPAP